jgi:hypothetical protein
MDTPNSRNVVSYIILGFGFTFIIAVTIQFIFDPTKVDAIQKMTTIFLPVIAAWVGTVIAFYFGKENFNVANDRIRELVDKVNPMEKLKKISIKDVMIPYDKIIKYDLPDGADYKKVLLYDLLIICKDKKQSRIPVIKTNKVLATVIHRSIIDLIISKNTLNPDPKKDVKNFTIQDLIDDEETKIFIKTQLCVKEDANLLDAKSAYDNEPNAQDVFITSSGSITEPILGWVTQNEIIKYLKN